MGQRRCSEHIPQLPLHQHNYPVEVAWYKDNRYSYGFPGNARGYPVHPIHLLLLCRTCHSLVQLVSKQGRANTQKPKILVQMLGEIIAFVAKAGLDITDYPITFGSWQGSQLLREDLEALLFSQIQVHAKNNHVFGMDSRWGQAADAQSRR